MYKELILSIIIVASIFCTDFITQNYTDKKLSNVINNLYELKGIIGKDNNENAEEKSKKILENLKSIHHKLAYYIEHDELEKVETDFTVCDSLIKSKNYDVAISELDRTIYVLEHIKDRYSFNFENLF